MSERVSRSSIIKNGRNRERRINGPTTKHGLCQDHWLTADRISLSQGNVWTSWKKTSTDPRDGSTRLFNDSRGNLQGIFVDCSREHFSSDIFPRGCQRWILTTSSNARCFLSHARRQSTDSCSAILHSPDSTKISISSFASLIISRRPRTPTSVAIKSRDNGDLFTSIAAQRNLPV